MEIQPLREETLPPTVNRFDRVLGEHGVAMPGRGRTTVLQINVGKLCNQACTHCHVEAGPRRREVMEAPLVERLLSLAAREAVETVDITGGAPELNPHFRELVEGMTALGKEVLVRCNLTILLEPGYGWLVDFYAAHGVQLICSLPCYTPGNVNRQRGEGVFEKSIAALRLLNARGYGMGGHPDGLRLDLVFNPLGAVLPGDQQTLEADYKRELRAHFGVEFNGLYTMANLPIGRFSRTLRRRGEYEPYLRRLEGAFNPGTLPRLMCRNTLSVSWDGRLYDCDFNQMLELELGAGAPSLSDPAFRLERLREVPIRTGEHCLGCTAGAGSSCGGALA
jgi:radical SAM/Cys-rich protein